MSYFQKYLKYKHKYLTLKQQLAQVGGGEEENKQIEVGTLSDQPTEDYSASPTEVSQTGGDEEQPENTHDEEKSEVSPKKKDTEEEKDGEKEDTEEEKEGEEEKEEEGEKKEEGEQEGGDNMTELATSEYSSSESDAESQNGGGDRSDTDSYLSDDESDLEQEGGAFFNHVIDNLSSSVKSFDLQKGNFDSELSSLSEFTS